MKVRDIMVKDIMTVSPDDTIQKTAQIMQEKDIGIVPVEKDGYLTGIITDRDITLRCVADGADCETKKAKDIMSGRIIYISPEHSVTEAARVMAREQIRRLPVCEDGKIVGILSLGDISRAKNFFSETAAAFCNICEQDPD